MRHGSVYTGGGGFDLAAQWIGWTNVFSVEKNSWCDSLLKKRFNATTRYRDAKQFDGKPYRGTIDVLSGGPPCQKFSFAGKGEMDMELWFEFIRIADETGAPILVAENVPGFAYREGGLALEQASLELENKGYEVLPIIIPASSKGAFTKRDRVWLVCFKKDAFNPDTNRLRSYRKEVNKQGNSEFQYEQISLPGSLVSESVRNGTDTRIFRDINGIPGRVDRTITIGNAIVPQVAFEIFKAINLMNHE